MINQGTPEERISRLEESNMELERQIEELTKLVRSLQETVSHLSMKDMRSQPLGPPPKFYPRPENPPSITIVPDPPNHAPPKFKLDVKDVEL